ncbi:MAG: ribonuclease G [Gammaproteobacteria bacterium]|nr:ribonuclease G [Gammaproteobacteria bacterium]MDH5734897.1 ribonuclease G [Gammaproteobacteria bacterium]
MSKEILINVTPQETRVAILENGVLQELYIERSRNKGLVGNIYKGRVCRVLPGMEAAFVEVGMERAAFLHVSDVIGYSLNKENSHETKISISQLLREGEDILVQVIKDPMGTKGARLTAHITIPSRYLVFMPNSNNVGVSARIEVEEERDRLREMLMQHEDVLGDSGYIIRTAAESAEPESMRQDIIYLKKLWESVREKSKEIKPGNVVHEDLPLSMRVLRDMIDSDLEKIRVDSRETWRRMEEFSAEFMPEASMIIEHYPGERPIFDLYGVEDEIQKSLDRKVHLKSGGYLIIDQTEAMTTIDVNTGAFVGHRNLEETIFKTNLEAAQAIARQLRLRNLGGIIILDFIDMIEEDHRRQVLRALEKALEKDHARTHVCEVSSLGLVEMTRKRTRESLEHILCEVCPACEGRGSVKTSETVCYEIFREILREARQFDAKQLLVLAAQDVIDMLVDEESNSLAELEDFIGIPIKLQVEALYTQEQYDVVIM